MTARASRRASSTWCSTAIAMARAAWAMAIAVEHQVELALREALAVILHDHPRRLAVRTAEPLRAHRDPRLGVVQRVGDQVLQHLPQLHLVAQHQQALRGLRAELK